MAEETKNAVEAAPVTTTTTEVAVVVSDVPEAEKSVEVPEKAEKSVEVPEKAEAGVVIEEEKKIGESGSFKEESNVVGELPDPEKLALDELKQLVQEALNKHEFTAPPPPPPVKEEEKVPEAEAVVVAAVEESTPKVESETPKVEAEASKVESEVTEKETPVAEPVVEKIVEKTETVVDDDGAKTVEAIKETIVAVCPPAPVSEEPTTSTPAEEKESSPVVVEEVKEEASAPAEEVVPVTPPVPEEVSIWGIPLLADERSDVILLKFLRARDFKVKEALAMLKSVVAWRKEFGIEDLLAEEFGNEHEKVVFMHGFDKEGHPVCYNSYGEFQNKELYINTFSDEEKRTKFLRWRIQFLERSIRNLDFSPDGICSFVQVNDLKNFPGIFKRELRQATDQAFQILQDNYPEFAAKQVMINVPWWYLAFYKMISPFFTVRTKSKFVFAGPSKTAESLFKYIAPEQVPVQYGGLSRDGEQEFSTANPAIEEIVKPTAKHTIEFSIAETCQLVWEARVVGWEVSYGAEFVPSAEDGYTVIIQKSRKIGPSDEPVICNSFKIGEPGKVVLTFDNQTSKKKKLLYRSKTIPSSESA